MTETIYFFDRCKRGEEQDKVAILMAMGIYASAPQVLEYKRQGKDRRPREVWETIVDTYYFARCTPHQFQAARSMGEIGDAHAEIAERAWGRSVQPFIDAADAAIADMRRRIKAGDVVDQYTKGDMLEILAGPFAGRHAPFHSPVDGDLFPMIEVLVEFMGKRHAVEVDPLAVRAVG